MELNVNGTIRSVNVESDTPLLRAIREELGMTGTKYGCGVAQCQVMAATALLKRNPKPTEEDIVAAMVNLCRCGTYNAIAAAVRDAAGI